MVLQISIPVYAQFQDQTPIFSKIFDPDNENIPLKEIADLSFNYENIDVRSITANAHPVHHIVIDCIGYGVVSIVLQPESPPINAVFVQRISLNIVGLRNTEVSIAGRSDLAIITPAGTLVFNGELQGITLIENKNVIFWMDFIGFSSSKSSVFDDSSGSEAFASNIVVISQLIQGALTRTGTTPDGKYPTFDMTLEATGTVLTIHK
ncbi:MAG: hypothetical protein ACXAES_07575 [Promethearchaeota archaeon]